MTESRIILTDLPKISLNKYYSGGHWGDRHNDKKNFISAVNYQCKSLFKKDKQYVVDYTFNFKNNPLDASNCAGMLKMIEDIIFESDSPKIVKKISIMSRKALTDFVEIFVNRKTIRSEVIEMMEEAADLLAEWGSHASKCIQEKHDLSGDIQRFVNMAGRLRNEGV